MSRLDHSPNLSGTEIRSLAEFRYQIRRFLHFSEEAARAEGLEPQQHQIMLAIHAWSGEEGPTMGQLADSMFIRHHSAVGLVDRLEERHMAERVHGRGDRREVRVRLTREGAATLERLASAHRAELESSGPVLVDALAAVLRAKSY